MGMTPAIDITAEQRGTILSLLERYLPGTTAWAYGSRVRRKSRPTSDLDLVVFATPEQDRRVGDLREAFEEGDLPFPVDLFVWDEIPENFRERIEAERVVLVEKQGWGKGRDWPTARLGQVTELTLSSVDKKTKPCEHAVLLCNYMDVYSNRFIRSDLDFMTATATDREIQRCTLRPEDVVITKDSEQYDDIGVPALVRDDIDGLVCGCHLAILRPLQESICGSYLLYALQIGNVQHQFHAYANGVTRFGLRKDDILRVEIPLPPLPEQRAIARILGALDDRIELNRRMNETLEAMARALFKSWFVDFDPVRAKMEGRDPGLPDRIADLFPDRLVDSEIGEIPEGWEISEIGEEVDACGGATPSTKESVYWVEGKLHWATPKDLAKLRSPVLLETDKKITDAGIRKISTGLLPIGTVLLSSRAPIGYLAIAEVPTAINQGFIAMVCRKRLPNLYVLFWCHENLDYIKNISGGSTFSEINKKSFRPIPVLVPLEEILTVYEDAIRPLYNRIVANAKESVSLTQIRDILLPKLMSGEVRLGEAIGRLGNAA